MPGSAQPLRLVLDTNEVVAGLLWNGPPRRLIAWAVEGEKLELFSSPALLDELAHTLGYAKFSTHTAGFATSVGALVAQTVATAFIDKFGGDSLVEMQARYELFHDLARQR
jgi:predicted nucleic acid-binding protein